MKRFLIFSCMVLFLVLLAAGQGKSAGPQDAALSGKVVETMDSGGYTYALLEKNGKKTWVAAPKMKITKGQNVAFHPGPEMVNFESKTLKRTFDRIIFSEGPVK